MQFYAIHVYGGLRLPSGPIIKYVDNMLNKYTKSLVFWLDNLTQHGRREREREQRIKIWPY